MTASDGGGSSWSVGAWFAIASLLCGLAPNPETLIVARVLQGVGGALLTPGSLAMIQASFRQDDRPTAIGAWSGLGSDLGGLGPFVGGALVGYVHWRWIFLINLPIAVVTILVAQRRVPETRDPHASTHFDLTGAFLATAALGGTTYALIEWGGLLAVYAGRARGAGRCGVRRGGEAGDAADARARHLR